MNREDIDTLWQQALCESVKAGEQFTRYHFAALVAAAEREACAHLVENMQQAAHRGESLDGWDVAYAIRARSKQ